MGYSSNKLINDLEAKTTPIDADTTVIGDSTDTNRAKKVTWANIKATLKSYFDTIYTNGVGTADEIAYWSDGDTVSSLSVATYPSKTELSYVKGVTSAIQTQINTKAPSTSPTFGISINGSYLTPSEIIGTDGSKNIVSLPVATYPSLTELSYVKGLTSSAQTQLNNLPSKLNINYTQVTTPADTNENTLYTFSIPANTLGTNSGVKLTIYFSDLTKTNNGTYTLKFKYGGTTLITLATAAAAVPNATGKIEFVLVATGATNSQLGFVTLLGNTEGSNIAQVGINYSANGTSSENSTNALNLVVTSTSQNTGTLSGYITASLFTLEKLN